MFTKEVIDQLQYYVYRLIDPRTGQTFYVGKGKGNRVFAHVNDALKILTVNLLSMTRKMMYLPKSSR